jgi:hypothetical protein
MRKEFESDLAEKVAGKKRLSKAWAMTALFAAILISGAMAVTVAAAGNGDMDQTKDQLKDGSCDDCDPIGDCDGDGICDYDTDGDGVCDIYEETHE